jgi:hypothetical protein
VAVDNLVEFPVCAVEFVQLSMWRNRDLQFGCCIVMLTVDITFMLISSFLVDIDHGYFNGVQFVIRRMLICW